MSVAPHAETTRAWFGVEGVRHPTDFGAASRVLASAAVEATLRGVPQAATFLMLSVLLLVANRCFQGGLPPPLTLLSAVAIVGGSLAARSTGPATRFARRWTTRAESGLAWVLSPVQKLLVGGPDWASGGLQPTALPKSPASKQPHHTLTAAQMLSADLSLTPQRAANIISAIEAGAHLSAPSFISIAAVATIGGEDPEMIRQALAALLLRFKLSAKFEPHHVKCQEAIGPAQDSTWAMEARGYPEVCPHCHEHIEGSDVIVKVLAYVPVVGL